MLLNEPLLQAHYNVVRQESYGETVKALGRIATTTVVHVSLWDHTKILGAAPDGPRASL